MNMLTLSRRRIRSAGATALAALLAMLASHATASDPPPSRYAAKQVRLPQEPAAPVAKAAKARVAQPGHVRPAAHQEPQRMPSRANPRTASRIPGRYAARERSIIVQEGEIMEGETIPAPPAEMVTEDGHTMHHSGAIQGDFVDSQGNCAGGACGESCGDACNGFCGRRVCTSCCVCLPQLCLDKFEFFAGAEGFTGPLNRGDGGSFGFHEGLNWGSNLLCGDLISTQLGAMATQSSFSGSDITDEDRRQFFITGGFFRRVDWGLQGGAVVDVLHDEWYYEPIDLMQVRGELSWVFPCNHELGFWFARSMNNATADSRIDVDTTVTTLIREDWRSTDLYAFFYRRQFDDCNATGRIFAGFTGESDGLLGADFNIPLTEQLALRSEFAYLVPSEGRSQSGNIEESWNVGLSLVWYPGCRTARSHDYNRPLFNVANNGSFMVDRHDGS